ncbi:pentapeptide repeat-containing protein [Streptomyces sp. NPDC058398]|uniref:serine/threonine-protein kinase n=1 Tax=Streptomyces sp. NPDC058398 TaxID=3346479 RepID=UPI00364C5C66
MTQALLAGRYRLKDVLGRGGMGVVWRAEDERIGRTVALKVLPPEYGVPAAQERLASEARALGRIWDPCVVAVLDYGQDADGTVFVVMELVAGHTLDRAAADASVPLILDWAGQICRALEVTHAAGLLHRDIKPGNVMVTPTGTVKLLDFGIARFVREPDRAHPLTLAGQAVGTPAYMAPEQLGAPGATDGRADLYALGCVLYELLTGARPECGGLYERKLPPPPSLHSREPLPPEVDGLVLALLAPGPKDRPADAGTARAMVGAAMDAWTRTHGPAGAWSAAPSWPARSGAGATPGAPAPFDPTVLLDAEAPSPAPGRATRTRVMPMSPSGLDRVRELAGWQRGHQEACRDPRTPAVKELRRLVEELAQLPGGLLAHVDLSGLNLDGAVLIQAGLAGALLTGTQLSFVLMPFADLREANLVGADLAGTYLGSADLAGADLSDAQLYTTHFTEANLTGARLAGANLVAAVLSDADLSGADLRGAILHGASLREAQLRGADLSGADLRGADLAGADLSGVRWSVETCWPFPSTALRKLSYSSQAPGGFVLPDACASPKLRRLLDGDGAR